jgi:hypothetical protein
MQNLSFRLARQNLQMELCRPRIGSAALHSGINHIFPVAIVCCWSPRLNPWLHSIAPRGLMLYSPNLLNREAAAHGSGFGRMTVCSLSLGMRSKPFERSTELRKTAEHIRSMAYMPQRDLIRALDSGNQRHAAQLQVPIICLNSPPKGPEERLSNFSHFSERPGCPVSDGTGSYCV